MYQLHFAPVLPLGFFNSIRNNRNASFHSQCEYSVFYHSISKYV